MNLWYPGATKREIAPGANDPSIIPCGIVLHVRAGRGKSLYDYFNGPSGGIESHLYVTYEGHMEQYRDFGHEADANYEGNSFYKHGKRYGLISIEHEGIAGEEWTTEQLETDKKFFLWARDNLNIPLVKIPAWNGEGVGYHSQFSQWNPHIHDCPCKERVAQYNNIILPWFETKPWMTESVPTPIPNPPVTSLPILGDDVFIATDPNTNAVYITRGDLTKTGKRKMGRLAGGPATPDSDNVTDYHDIIDRNKSIPGYTIAAKELENLGYAVEGQDPDYYTSLGDK